MAINMIYIEFMGDLDGQEPSLTQGADLGSDLEVMMAAAAETEVVNELVAVVFSVLA